MKHRDMTTCRCPASIENRHLEACPHFKPKGMPGRKDDQGKPRWDLLPWRAVSSLVAVLTTGATKYDDHNWQRVEDRRERYFAAAQRHVNAWWLGEKVDQETGLPHLAHACCCLLFLLSEEVGFD